ncbi:MAG: hypothetical protein U0R17_02665 [Acidimicrobiia bacterium]
MGQNITISKLPSASDSIHLYQLNRSLSGMEILNYADHDMVVDENDPSQVLAKRLFDIGVQEVSVYSNVVTITCENDVFNKIQNKIEKIIEDLFIYYI